MQRGELESAFERWRSQGDLRSLELVIDRASPELLSLAARLAPDLAEAEDLVQTTFLALIEKPHAWDARRPLIPWLVGILTKRAIDSKRTARRHIEPSALAERAVEAPERLAADAETSKAVRQALAELPPLYREVVQRSVLDGERPLDIARTLERAPGTVRTQLLRGLELLRRALPAGLAGGGALVLAGTRGEAAIRAHVLSRAAELPISAAPLATIPLVGGALVSTKLLVASAAVVVAALATWLAWPDDRREVLDTSIAAGSPTSALAPALEPNEPSGATTEALRMQAAEPPSPATTSDASTREGWWLVGSVRGAHALDVGGAEVEVVQQGGGSRVVRVQNDGSFEVELIGMLREPEKRSEPPLALAVPVGALHVTARHPDYLSQVEVIPGESLPPTRTAGQRIEVHCEPKLLPAAMVRGSVVCEPKAPADIEVLFLGEGGHTLAADTKIAAGGEFRFRAPRSGTYAVQASCAGHEPAATLVELQAGRELALPTLVLVRTTCAIEGRVDLPEGIDLDELKLRAIRRSSDEREPLELPTIGFANRASFRDVRGGTAYFTQRVPIASDGTFRIDGLVSGRWQIEIEPLPGHLPGIVPMFAEAPAKNVVLGSHLGLVRLRTESEGKPVGGALSSWTGGGQRYRVRTDEAGRYTGLADLRLDYTVRALVDTVEHPPLELPAAGRPRVLDVVLEVPTLASPEPAILELVPPAGASRPQLLALLLRERVDEGSHAEGDRAEGRLRSPGASLVGDRYRLEVPAGRWTVDVGPGSEMSPPAFFGSYLLTERFELDVQPGERVERPIVLRPGGRLRVLPRGVEDAAAVATWTVTSAGGRPVEGRFWSRRLEGNEERSASFQDHLPTVLPLHFESALEPCLEPGRYTLTIDSPEWQAAPASFEIEAGKTTEVELPLWKK